MTSQPYRIQCDTDGCGAVITVSHLIDEVQSAAIARAAGWFASLGSQRFYHRCPKHREVKR